MTRPRIVIGIQHTLESLADTAKSRADVLIAADPNPKSAILPWVKSVSKNNGKWDWSTQIWGNQAASLQSLYDIMRLDATLLGNLQNRSIISYHLCSHEDSEVFNCRDGSGANYQETVIVT